LWLNDCAKQSKNREVSASKDDCIDVFIDILRYLIEKCRIVAGPENKEKMDAIEIALNGAMEEGYYGNSESGAIRREVQKAFEAVG